MTRIAYHAICAARRSANGQKMMIRSKFTSRNPEKKCGWASVKCGLKEDTDRSGKFISKDKNRQPTSKAMEKARLQTFTWQNSWPHDDNHGANAKNMAKAGFIPVPTEDSDDTATCAYCDVILSGWEEEDDPMQEHRKRASNCPMFPDLANTLKASTSKSKPKAKAAHSDVVMPVKDYDGPEDEQISDLKASTTAKTPSRRKVSTRGAKTPAVRARSSSRSRKATADEDDSDDDEPQSRGVTPAPTTKAQKPAPGHKRTRSRSKSVAPPTDADEETPAIAPTRPTRSRAKSKGVGSDSDDQSAPSTKAPLARKKSKARVSVIQEDEAAEEEEDRDAVEEEEIEEIPPPPPAKTLKRSTSRRVVHTEPNPPEEDTQPPPPPPRTRKNSRAPAPPSAATSSKSAQQQSLGVGTTKKGGHKRSASSASQRGKGRAISPPEDIDVQAGEEELDAIMQDVRRSPSPPPPSPPRPPATVKPAKAKSKAKPAPADHDSDTNVEMAESSHPAPVLPSMKTRPPLSRAASSEVSRTKVKALASRYESEEPAPSPAKSHKPNQHSQSSLSSIAAPPARPPSRTVVTTKPVSKMSMSHSRSGSRDQDVELQLVEISSDEEDEGHPKTPSPKKPKKKMKKPTAQEEEKENKRSEDLHAMDQDRERERQREMPEVQQKATVDHHKAEPPVLPREEDLNESHHEEETQPETILPPVEDVEMKGVEAKEELLPPGVKIPVGRPVTPPPHPTAAAAMHSFPPKTPSMRGAAAVPPTPGVTYYPPLSKEPFVNLDVLTEEELDMTVEEWIRYQMLIEYEKLKRDGNEELAAFQRKADEVRRTIEAL